MLKKLSIIKSFRSGSPAWIFSALILLILLSLPLLLIVFSLFKDSNNSDLFSLTVTSDAVINSLLLCIGIGTLTLFGGTLCAWLVTQYQFPFSKFFSWSLVLPLTVPGYIMAYSYAGIFNYAGPLQTFLRTNFGTETAKTFYFDFLTFPSLIFCLTLALFPYVFISAKTAFSYNTRLYLEAGKSLGKSGYKLFFSVALPLARPALAAGTFLVLMEVLNDYGAAGYFGVRTFTTSIFRSWTFDLNAALHLAAILLLFVFLLMAIERYSRGKAKYAAARSLRPAEKETLSGYRKWIAFTVCALPFIFGFVIPVLYLISGMIHTYDKVVDHRFWIMTWNSFQLALLASFVVIIAALLISYNKHLHQNRLGKSISSLATTGYAIPGAVIAVGVLIPAGIVDGWISSGSGTKGLLFTGSIFLMIYAYLVRFLAVAYQPIDAAMQKNARTYSESSRLLGKNPLQTLWKIDLPIIRKSVIAAAILVFVDVLKELPLTLILRPFDFDTLATETYRQAKVMESIPESGTAALIIIFTGLVPMLLLNRLMKQDVA